MASAERYRTHKRKGRDKEVVRIVTGGEVKKYEGRPEQKGHRQEKQGKVKSAI